MILYNIKHRGPFEYEKFTLNILQIANEIKYLSEIYLKEDKKQIIKELEMIQTLYKKTTDINSPLNELLNIKLKTE